MEVLNRQLDPECAVIVFPELDLSPYPVIQAVIKRTHLRPAFRLVMGFDRSLILVPPFADWRFNRCMGG